MSERSTTLMAAAAALALLALGGCGGSNPSTPTPVPTPTPRPTPLTTTLRTGSFTGLEPNFLLVLPFGSTVIGDLEAIVDWTFAENDLDLFLARGNDPCTNASNRVDFNQCTLVATETGATTKPERLRVTALPSGSYTLYVGNRGPGVESLSYQVLLTFTPGAAAPDPGLSGLGGAAARGYVRQAARPWRGDVE